MSRIVLITGAKGGLGNSVTGAFLAAGDTVVGVARHIQASDFPHASFTPFPADLSSTKAVDDMVVEVVRRFQRIDVLVHLVGGFAGGMAIAGTTDDTWDYMMEVNVNCAFRVFRAVIAHMRSAKGGRIVAVGSRASLEPGANVGAYSASKAAVLSLVRTAAAENAIYGITANAVLPGTMDTPANRAAMPTADFSKWVPTRRVAEVILFLTTDAAADINGAAIPVYGPAV